MATETRMQMVKGSVWKLIKDVTLERLADNPAFTSAVSQKIDELRDINITNRNNPNFTLLEWEEIKKLANKHAKSLGISETVVVNTVSLNAGDILKVTDKSTTNYWISRPYQYYNGLYFPVHITSIDGREREGWIPYKGLENAIELQSTVVAHAFVIRDKSTGKLFKEAKFKTIETKYSWRYEFEGFEMVDKYTQSKRWTDLNKLRLWIMGKSGYYDGLPGAENMPDWAGVCKEFDIPDTWEIVEYDKLTKTEFQVHDLQTWYKRLWELRDLTIKFGSPVRKLYNEIDKKGDLDKFKGMLVMRTPVLIENDSYYGKQRSYEEELNPNDVKEIDEAIKAVGVKRGDIKRSKDNHCVAIAFSSLDQAVMIKLTYTGKLRLDCIDLETLKETVAS